MARKILRTVLALAGAGIACGIVALVGSIPVASPTDPARTVDISVLFVPWGWALIYVLSGLLFAIIFFYISPKLIDRISHILKATEDQLTKMPLAQVFFMIAGLILGLLVALLLSTLVRLIPIGWLAGLISVVLYALCGYFGVLVALKRRGEIGEGGLFARRAGKEKAGQGIEWARPKVLDTSVIIDGRIFDICKTGVIEGTLVVPEFVLRELRHIADSADAMKRSRGRRGLDILNNMNKDLEQTIRVDERDYKDVPEVDLKLLRLAQELKGVVVTNDYNLNKVATVQNVPVFNINELANAIKPVVLPGEELRVSIVKEGKETGQGVAYFDDGTMIVIDGGKRYIGEEIDTVVTSVLQTAAGRMIFAKLS